MKSIYRCVLLIVLGLLLLMSGGAMTLLVRVLGMVFLLPAALSLVRYLASRRGGADADVSPVPGLVIDTGSLVFGMWLLVSPDTFVAVFAKILAVLILVMAVYHLYRLVQLRRSGKVVVLMSVVPLALLVAALLVLADVVADGEPASLVLGVGVLVSGLVDVVILVMLKRLAGNVASAQPPVQEP